MHLHRLEQLRNVLAVVTVSAAFVVAACRPAPPSTPPDGTKLALCVAGELAKGVEDPVAIGLACGEDVPQVVSDIVQTLEKTAPPIAARRAMKEGRDGGCP
jgi:hypothetical protein